MMQKTIIEPSVAVSVGINRRCYVTVPLHHANTGVTIANLRRFLRKMSEQTQIIIASQNSRVKNKGIWKITSENKKDGFYRADQV